MADNLDFMSSLIACLAIRTIVAPINRMKILFQSQTDLQRTGKILNPYTYKTCYHQIRSEGFKSLYRGNVPNLCAQVVTSCVISHKPTKQWVSVGIPGTVDPLSLFLGVMLRYPFEFASTRLAADVVNMKGKREFKGTYDVLYKTYTHDGVRGIYRGCATTFYGHATLYLTMLLLHNLSDNVPRGGTPLVIFPLSVIYLTGSHFWDTVSTRMKMTSGRPSRNVYKNTLQCIFQIMEKEKPKSLVAGFFAACAIGLIFESLGSHWKKENEEPGDPVATFTGPANLGMLERQGSDNNKNPLE